MNGVTLLLYDNQGQVENLRRLMEIGQEIIRSIPEYVLHERGPGGQEGGRA
jgi:hypothetical protein